jgi:hypothetical protein
MFTVEVFTVAKFGIETDTTVVPVVSPSNATPPLATVVGE